MKNSEYINPYIRKFKSKAGVPCFFENFAGFYADQEEKLWNKIKEIEEQTDCLVYAVTHEGFSFGECWTMLCISEYTYKIEEVLSDAPAPAGKPWYEAYAYVWNATDDNLSEFGYVTVAAHYGGIRRLY